MNRASDKLKAAVAGVVVNLPPVRVDRGGPAVKLEPAATSRPAVLPIRQDAGELTADQVGREWLTIEQVAEYVGVSSRTIRRLVDGQGFPSPYYVTPSRPRWRASDVEEWVLSRPRLGNPW